jgi:hypothetical protein
LGGRGRGRWISEFKVSLYYRVSSRTARTTQRNPVSKKKKKKTTTTKKKKERNGGAAQRTSCINSWVQSPTPKLNE